VETQVGRPELLTVEETVELLRCGRTKVNALLWSGDLPSLKIGRRRLVRRADLQRFLDERRDAPEE
jgi:excisionase family DNA binding protein